MPEDDRQLTDAPRYATLPDYTRVFRERWRLIAAFAAVFAAIAFAYSAAQPKTYEAKTTLNARQQAADLSILGGTSGPAVAPQALTAQLATMADRDSIAARVKRALDTPLSVSQVAARVSSSIDVQTNLVVLDARDEDPDFAARLANEYGTQVKDEAVRSERHQIDGALNLVRRQLKNAKEQAVVPGASDEVTILQERFNRLQALKKISEPVEIVTKAGPPTSPVSPRPKRNTVLGLLAGLFLGIIAAFARDAFDTRLKAPREIEEHFGLTRIGQLSELALGRTILSNNGRRQLDPADLEAARIMRTNLDFLGGSKPLRSLVVTSPLPGEGKSTVAISLAWASVMSGKLTLLIECDLRQPVLAQRLGLRPAPGLTDVLLSNAGPPEVLQMVDLGGANPATGGVSGAGHLICITAGTQVANPAELLGSDKFSDLLGEVTAAYDLVVLDTSPMLSVVDTRELLPRADAVVVCARSYQTTRDQARATRDALDQVSAPLAGLVVTGVRFNDDEYYGYYYRYAGSSKS